MKRPALSSLPPLVKRIGRIVEKRVQIDTRTLAVFRVWIGLLVIADLFLRSRNFSFYYTDDGVVPRSLALDLSTEGAFSVYHFTTDPTIIFALFVIQGLIAMQLIVGYRTRIATILTFLFVISLDHHNPLVTSYADTLFRFLTFWAIFLPLGERWSIDAVHAERKPRLAIASFASAAILFQMVYLYLVNGLHKTESDLWTGGEAAVHVFGIDEMTFLIGDFMRNFPTLLQYGGLLWFYMLLFSWLLVVFQGRRRMLLVAMFMAGHASFALTVRIGAFAYVAIGGVMLFLQAQFWRDGKSLLEYLDVYDDHVEPRVATLERRGTAVAKQIPSLRPTLEMPAYDTLKVGVYILVLSIAITSVLVLPSLSVLSGSTLTDREIGSQSGIDEIDDTVNRLGISQPEWGVFAPHPRTTDRYYVFPAQTADGELIDVYNDRPQTYDRPYNDELQKQHDTYRMRFYMNSIRRAGSHNPAPELLAEHMCEEWADEHDTELTHINMYEITEDITLETIDSPEDREPESSLIYRHGCGESSPIVIDPPEF